MPANQGQQAQAQLRPPVQNQQEGGEDRTALLMAILAAVCWAGAVLLLVSVDLGRDALAPTRVLFYLLVLAAGALTFVPLELSLHAPGLALEGIAGSFLLLYTIAFVPAPKGWLLSLPDMPVYIVLAAGVFWACAAAARPFILIASQRFFQQRARQYDLRRARRQSYEVGLAAALCLALAGLRVLTPLGVLLVILILVVMELMFLSFVEARTS